MSRAGLYSGVESIGTARNQHSPKKSGGAPPSAQSVGGKADFPKLMSYTFMREKERKRSDGASQMDQEALRDETQNIFKHLLTQINKHTRQFF